MKTIIVPVDFSEQSEYALKVAASLARKQKAEILVLHMLELNEAMITSSEGFHPEQTVFLLKLAEKRLGEFLNKAYLKGIKITPVIKHFKVFGEVNDIAEKHNADMIIMGSHGSDGLKEIFVGSNAEKVVRYSEIPVLVVKSELPDFKIDDFVFACNFKSESLSAFQKAREFASKLGAKLHMVYINTPGDDFLSTQDAYEKINKYLEMAGAGQEVTIYNDYSVEKGVLNFSESIHADLIGIPTHGRKGLSHFFMGSIGEDITNHSKVPVITFKI
ncbi:Nucleotide-binding universal stress protein, UspA family [Muriicola jejuensis]|uniref:Universal stress protein n=1 Tax=Muriicola jejuensis TaxID=504488 RepID=A0A6P0UEC2_9FLAO|nr:universal stress protein [Muriicola jejuensis]NER09613.1 universal stress protein [Muriicola jejuensis]SMP07389.1 Nucleotide-binding universal stress protein, UspA family [Muriicola jejuensis]